MKKYRAKTSSEGKWVSGLLLNNSTISDLSGGSLFESDVDCTDSGVYKCRAYRVKPDSVCRNTGFKDVNGIDIYENDIIGDYSNRTRVVEFNEDLNCFDLHDLKNIIYELDNLQIGVNDFRVVGNIFDNKELLK